MKKLAFLVLIGLTFVSCQEEEITPNPATPTNPADTTGNNTNWNPFNPEFSFYVDYYINCSGCNRNDIIDTIFYKNVTTGDSTLIVVDNQIITTFPNSTLPIYPDSVYFMGTDNDGGYTRIGLQNAHHGDSIYVYVKFSGLGSYWGCGIYEDDLPGAASWNYINNVGSDLRISNGFRLN